MAVPCVLSIAAIFAECCIYPLATNSDENWWFLEKKLYICSMKICNSYNPFCYSDSQLKGLAIVGCAVPPPPAK